MKIMTLFQVFLLMEVGKTLDVLHDSRSDMTLPEGHLVN